MKTTADGLEVQTLGGWKMGGRSCETSARRGTAISWQPESVGASVTGAEGTTCLQQQKQSWSWEPSASQSNVEWEPKAGSRQSITRRSIAAADSSTMAAPIMIVRLAHICIDYHTPNDTGQSLSFMRATLYPSSPLPTPADP